MDDAVKVDSVNFEVNEIRYVDAGEDFGKGSRSYDSTIFAEIHLYINGDEITHKNKLPANFDLVNTARAQAEIVQALNEQKEYTGEPFCCTCGNRGCAHIRWKARISDKEPKIE